MNKVLLVLILWFCSFIAWGQEEQVFQVVEEMPYWGTCANVQRKDRSGCSNKRIYDFIDKKLQYPSEALKNQIEGTVVVNFIVDHKDGSLDNIRLLRDIGGGCGEEAMRVVKLMPNFIPGKQRGESINVSFNLPVKFELPEK